MVEVAASHPLFDLVHTLNANFQTQEHLNRLTLGFILDAPTTTHNEQLTKPQPSMLTTGHTFPDLYMGLDPPGPTCP